MVKYARNRAGTRFLSKIVCGYSPGFCSFVFHLIRQDYFLKNLEQKLQCEIKRDKTAGKPDSLLQPSGMFLVSWNCIINNTSLQAHSERHVTHPTFPRDLS